MAQRFTSKAKKSRPDFGRLGVLTVSDYFGGLHSEARTPMGCTRVITFLQAMKGDVCVRGSFRKCLPGPGGTGKARIGDKTRGAYSCLAAAY